MRIKPAMLALFLISGVIGCASAIPLSVGFGMLGLKEQGVSYAHARGTIWKGEMIGVSLGSNRIGSLALDARPLDLLRGRWTYGFRWQSNIGRGQGLVHIRSPERFEVQGGRFLLEDASSSLTLQISDLAAELQESGCASASGTLRVVGQGPSSASGRINCAAEKFLVAFDDQSDANNAQLNQQIEAALSMPSSETQ